VLELMRKKQPRLLQEKEPNSYFAIWTA